MCWIGIKEPTFKGTHMITQFIIVHLKITNKKSVNVCRALTNSNQRKLSLKWI